MNRCKAFLTALNDRGCGAALIHRPENIRWLTGYTGEGCVFVSENAQVVVTDFRYVEQAGLLSRYSVVGIQTAQGSYDLTGATQGQLGWSGVGQYNDLVNPCAMMVWMGAIANQGKTAVPYLISKTEGDLPLPSLPHFTKHTGQLINADTAQVVGDMMANNVRETYGSSRFPNMDICAKSGTAEVGGGKQPNAWFAGFLRNSDAPYAFVVVLEEGGSGANAAGNVAAQVLDALVNGY